MQSSRRMNLHYSTNGVEKALARARGARGSESRVVLRAYKYRYTTGPGGRAPSSTWALSRATSWGRSRFATPR